MSESFLHGVEVIEIDDGARPISTVRSSIIGIVGTAPDIENDIDATLTIGAVRDTLAGAATNANTRLVFTSLLPGEQGNLIRLRIFKPPIKNSALTITVNGLWIDISLETDAAGALASTAAEVLTAVNAHTTAGALVEVTHGAQTYIVDKVKTTETSTGAGILRPTGIRFLTGGKLSPLPLDTPYLITNRLDASKFGLTGTLPAAFDAIWDQQNTWIVAVRVAVGADDAETLANVIGSAASGDGMYALLAANSVVGVQPRILIIPGFTDEESVVAELLPIAERLRAVVIADGPNTTSAAALDYRNNFDSDRLYLVDPGVKVTAIKLIEGVPKAVTESQVSSARVAGLLAKSDNQNGFWFSPSNQTVSGITGTDRPIDFTFGDPNSEANYLNELQISTIIRYQGFRLWGNRTCTGDKKWSFLSVRRIADMLHESLLQAHLWAVDRNITKTYIEDVTEGVNKYIKHLVKVGALINGRCWADASMNTPDQIAQGKVYFDFDFSVPYPAEQITFRSHLVNDYLVEIFT